jgi:hypothetical protein
MPVVINYKVELPRQPFRYYLVSTGTTIDWFFPDLLSGRPSSFRPATFQNLLVAIRTGRERLRGKLEVGVELQYSFRYFDYTNHGYHPTETFVHSKLNMISLVMNYLFINKQRQNIAI